MFRRKHRERKSEGGRLRPGDEGKQIPSGEGRGTSPGEAPDRAGDFDHQRGELAATDSHEERAPHQRATQLSDIDTEHSEGDEPQSGATLAEERTPPLTQAADKTGGEDLDSGPPERLGQREALAERKSDGPRKTPRKASRSRTDGGHANTGQVGAGEGETLVSTGTQQTTPAIQDDQAASTSSATHPGVADIDNFTQMGAGRAREESIRLDTSITLLGTIRALIDIQIDHETIGEAGDRDREIRNLRLYKSVITQLLDQEYWFGVRRCGILSEWFHTQKLCYRRLDYARAEELEANPLIAPPAGHKSWLEAVHAATRERLEVEWRAGAEHWVVTSTDTPRTILTERILDRTFLVSRMQEHGFAIASRRPQLRDIGLGRVPDAKWLAARKAERRERRILHTGNHADSDSDLEVEDLEQETASSDEEGSDRGQPDDPYDEYWQPGHAERRKSWEFKLKTDPTPPKPRYEQKEDKSPAGTGRASASSSSPGLSMSHLGLGLTSQGQGGGHAFHSPANTTQRYGGGLTMPGTGLRKASLGGDTPSTPSKRSAVMLGDSDTKPSAIAVYNNAVTCVPINVSVTELKKVAREYQSRKVALQALPPLMTFFQGQHLNNLLYHLWGEVIADQPEDDDQPDSYKRASPQRVLTRCINFLTRHSKEEVMTTQLRMFSIGDISLGSVNIYNGWFANEWTTWQSKVDALLRRDMQLEEGDETITFVHLQQLETTDEKVRRLSVDAVKKILDTWGKHSNSKVQGFARLLNALQHGEHSDLFGDTPLLKHTVTQLWQLMKAVVSRATTAARAIKIFHDYMPLEGRAPGDKMPGGGTPIKTAAGEKSTKSPRKGDKPLKSAMKPQSAFDSPIAAEKCYQCGRSHPGECAYDLHPDRNTNRDVAFVDSVQGKKYAAYLETLHDKYYDPTRLGRPCSDRREFLWKTKSFNTKSSKFKNDKKKFGRGPNKGESK